jgi:Na+/melibiose symporter-like transporter
VRLVISASTGFGAAIGVATSGDSTSSAIAVCQKNAAAQRIVPNVMSTPILEVIKRHPKEIILSAFARMAEQAPFYIFTAFIFSYGIGTLHVSRDFLLTAVLVASVLSFFSIPFFGHLSDRIGRKNMYMIGAVVTGVFGFVYFGMLNTGVAAIIFLAIVFWMACIVPRSLLVV